MWFPLSTRCRRGIILGIFVLLLVWGGRLVYIATHWPEYCEQYGPMRRHESQCLICQRMRDEKWVCGEKVRDTITTNEYSDWVDSFVSKDHDHVWLIGTSYARRGWFKGTSIGCGGAPVISNIYSKRSEFGEQTAQRLVAKFHKLVRSPSFEKDLGPMDKFLDAAMSDPAALLSVDE